MSMLTPNNGIVTFKSTAGEPFLQTWPTANRAAGTLAFDGAAGTFAYRPPGAQEASVFRSSDGRLIALRNVATGHEAQVSYTAAGLPQTFTDSWTGTTWNLSLDSQNRITTIAIAGRSDLDWTYSYDGNGNLVSVLAPGNATWRTYEYSANRITASRDALGNLIESHSYDSDGHAIDSTGDVDEIASIQYDLTTSNPGESLTRVTLKTGEITDYILRAAGGAWRAVQIIGGCSSCGSRNATYVRDDAGRVIRQQDASGYIVTSTYDPDSGNLLSRTTNQQPVGCNPETDPARCRLTTDSLNDTVLQPTSATLTTNYVYGDPNWPERPTEVSSPSLATGLTRRTLTQYHPVTGEAAIQDSFAATEGTANERTTQTQFYGDVVPPPSGGSGNQDGPPSATPGPLAPAFDPGGSFSASWLTLSQPAGLRRSFDGPRGDVWDVDLFVYYPIDTSVPGDLRGRLAATKNAAGHITHYESYDVFGNLTRVVDANGVATESACDLLGRVATHTVKAVAGCDTTADPLCATDLTNTRTYSAAGPLAAEQRPAGGVTAYSYDDRGRVLTISRGPSSDDLRERIEYTYDPLTGKKSLERTLGFEGGAWTEKKRESFAYDGLGQLLTITHADGASIAYAYDIAGRVFTMRDENHTTPNTTYAYDPAGRVAVVNQTLATATNGTISTTYTYDIHGNLSSVTDPNGNVTTYASSDFGQVITQQSPVTGATGYAYDSAGNLVNSIDANGTTTVRIYDAMGRPLLAVSTKNGEVPPVTSRGLSRPIVRQSSNESETVSWTYDDPTVGQFGIGRMASMTDPAGATTYAYERRGLLRTEQRAVASGIGLTTFRYDADANRISIGYPSGRVVNYSFDYADRPTSASSGTATLVSSAAYLPFGPAKDIVYGNGTEQT
ncbi:MAG: hypothetical protein ACRD2I_02635, partial [Vicinamibacterales bacterium]